ncbi:MAG: type III-B CRISPR module RAMP protein Cmr4 [Calditrichaeota bacterium]|nr:MAG: type III-B CRISPR module RAMP protein Cmr4 [Calditrichota bacterium]
MNYKHNLIIYQNITPLHVGCGQAVGVVDLPVIRERSTGYPYIPGSGIRGCLRDIAEEADADKSSAKTLFGPESDSNEENKHAGCMAIHDARLLFYPVRSDNHIFLWIICPAVLRRFNRDLDAFLPGSNLKIDVSATNAVNAEQYIGTAATGLLHLEEFALQHGDDTIAEKLAEFAKKFIGYFDGSPERLVLVSDRNFYHFVNYATMLVQHNTLTSAKTVKNGALFSIESMPPETVFYGMISGTRERENYKSGMKKEQVVARFKEKVFKNKKNLTLHLGGKESIGHGLTQMTWTA